MSASPPSAAPKAAPLFRSVAPYLIVDDLVASAAFYRDRLGFRFDRYWGQPPSFVMVWRDNVTIMLKSLSRPGLVRPNRLADADACWDAYLWVADARALYEEFQGRGVAVARPIEDQSYGCRDFDVHDNSGYCLCFGQDLGPQPDW